MRDLALRPITTRDGRDSGGTRSQRTVRLPPVRDFEPEFAAVTRISEELRTVHRLAFREARQVIERAEALCESLDLDDIVQELFARKELAPERLVAQQIALLLGSFPNSKPGNPEIFGRMIVEDACHARPSVGALDDACRSLRRGSVFVPSISEVLRAIEWAEASLTARIEAFRGLPERIVLMRNLLDRREAEAGERSRAIAEREERKKAEIRALLEADKPTNKFRFLDVWEVQREIAAERGSRFPVRR